MSEPVTATGAANRPIAVKRRLVRTGLVFEFAMTIALATSIAWVIWRFVHDGYLPQPFYYRVDDSLMDLYTTAAWAFHTGAYSVWHSIYPPISFDVLRLFAERRCYAAGAFVGRSCDSAASITLAIFFVFNVGLVYLSYRRWDRGTAIPRALAVSLGLPMLYALERGNLLIPCFTAFVLGVGPLVRSAFWRAVALAVSVNFKPYLLAVMLPEAVRRDWKWLLRVAVIGLAIYAVTFFFEGAGTPLQLLSDVGDYRIGSGDALWANLYYATSSWPLARYVAGHQAFAAGLDPWSTALVSLVAVSLMRAVQLGVLLCTVAALARPSTVDSRRFMALYAAMILTTVTNGSSGYALIFLFYLVFFEPWSDPVRIAMLSATYLLCLPIDWAFWPVIHGPAHSYLGARVVDVSFGVSLGQMVRPILLLIVQFGLIVLNLQDALRGDGKTTLAAMIAPASVAGARPKL